MACFLKVPQYSSICYAHLSPYRKQFCVLGATLWKTIHTQLSQTHGLFPMCFNVQCQCSWNCSETLLMSHELSQTPSITAMGDDKPNINKRFLKEMWLRWEVLDCNTVGREVRKTHGKCKICFDYKGELCSRNSPTITYKITFFNTDSHHKDEHITPTPKWSTIITIK